MQVFVNYWWYLFNWVIFIIIVVAIYVTYVIISFFMRRYLKKAKLHLDIINGVKAGVRLISIILVFVIFIYLSPFLFEGGIPQEIAITIAAVTGTIIALSTTSVIQNFIAGLYIIITRPYKVGDLIKIGNREGVVEEISLNHTKIRRPSGVQHYLSNQAIINSKIINFTITDKRLEHIRGARGSSLWKEFLKKEIIRYVFNLELPKEDPLKTKKVLKEISEKYEKLFLYPPEYITSAFVYKVFVSFVLITDDPKIIFKYKPKFVEDIYRNLFKKV
ncbi:MAG: hypothetical protein EAX96_02255 [Candidatus Lokiarchaeota archaeon]|nr:hypothetical protein [Candidatus Lokiarchaeota archaeon]